MRGILFDGGPYAGLVFIGLTLVLGGGAALATGRALAITWRKPRILVAYMAILAAAVGFLHYALFAESVIPLNRVLQAIALLRTYPIEALVSLVASLWYYWVTFAVLLVISFTGYSIARASAVTRQYGFAYTRRGLFGWVPRHPTKTEPDHA